MSWSRIQDTLLAAEAYVLMNENEIKGCEYHNNSHIEAMYQYLEDTNVPYDEALDWAVMFHDIVYDNQPDKEYRSKIKFAEMVVFGFNVKMTADFIGEVQSLIMETATHSVTVHTSEKAKAIICADLHALTNKPQTVNNFVKIMNESINLYGCTVEEFAENNVSFMNKLKETMMLNILVDNANESFYNSVIEGINTTRKLAQALEK